MKFDDMHLKKIWKQQKNRILEQTKFHCLVMSNVPAGKFQYRDCVRLTLYGICCVCTLYNLGKKTHLLQLIWTDRSWMLRYACISIL